MTNESKWYCYILKNSYEPDKNRTYNGFTNNPKRRIRQHNKEIKGGAVYTGKHGNNSWEMYALVCGFPDNINALQCEWRIKHPNNKRKRPTKYNSPSGRIKGLNEVLKLDYWTNQSTCKNSDTKLDVYILKEYVDLLKDVPDHVTIHVVDDKLDLKKIMEEQNNK
jgi:predicted GIY-YIG superfamily endonuclease